MKLLSTLVLALAAPIVLHAQTWTQQTSGTTRSINSIWALNTNTAVAVGAQGGCWRTTNGGTNWGAITTGLTSDLKSIKFRTGTEALVVGDGQDILTTANGGTSWTSIGGGLTDLHDGAMLSGTSGWVVGEQEVGFGFLYNPFTFELRQPAAVSGKEIHGIWAFSATRAWIVGDGGVVLTTTTGGSNWTQQTSNTTARLNKVAINGSSGVAVGNGGVIIHTTNSGTDWAVATSNTTQNLNGVCFVNDQNVYAVGDGGTILHSQNGGATWESEQSGVSANLNGVHGTGNSVWAVGIGGLILKRGGATAAKPRAAELFTLYPNPAEERLTVSAGSAVQQYSIYNLLGERLVKGDGSGKTAQIDVNALKPGLYMLEVETTAGSQVRKFRKE